MLLEEKDEGIVLKSFDYKDRQKIITLFTSAHGVINLIVKKMTRKNSHLLALTTPLTQGEYHFAIRKSELYTFCDGSLLKTHYDLRQNLQHLQAASLFIQALLSSQLPGIPAPNLYRLTCTYLNYLPSFSDPSSMTASFLLKLLKHDGHLNPLHKAPLFSYAEWEEVHFLAEAKNISSLKARNVSPNLHKLIESLFKERLDSSAKALL